MDKPSLLYFGADAPWPDLLKNGFSRRNTNLLKCFAESKAYSQVVSVHPVTRAQILRIIFSHKKAVGQVKDVFVAGFFPEKFNFAVFKHINHLLFLIQFWAQGVRQFNKNNNILFCYWPKGYKLCRKIQLNGKLVFDTDHNIIHDENLNPNQLLAQEQLLLDAGKHSFCIVSSTRSMLSWYHDKGYKNTFRLRNGISTERFDTIDIITKKNERPLIGYIGTVSKWIDYDAYEMLIRRNPQWDFAIYGPVYKSQQYKRFESYPNVLFKGPIKAQQVPEVIATFNVALNLYRNEPWLDVDSMKLYEYLAGHVPVVSFNYHSYLTEDFENLLYVVDDVSEMEKAINELLLRPMPLGGFSSFINKSTWAKRVETLNHEILNK